MRAILLILAAMTSPALAQDTTAEAGKAAFRTCTACHGVGPGATNRMGPNLTGVVGRKAASVEGFGYSTAMKAAAEAGLVWTPAALDAFLTATHDYVPGTKMPNLHLDDKRRADLIAWLATFSPGYDEKADVSTYEPPAKATP